LSGHIGLDGLRNVRAGRGKSSRAAKPSIADGGVVGVKAFWTSKANFV
jgi:hypothetical protein